MGGYNTHYLLTNAPVTPLDRGNTAFNFPMVRLHGLFFLKNQLTKYLDLSLGVDWMWTKRDDHAPKSERVDLKFTYMFQKGSLEN